MTKPIYIQGYTKRKHPLYSRYHGVLARCYNEKNKEYARYGGRGIKVVARWRGSKGFDHFVEDMGPCPKGYTLDRINGNLSYGPDNCRWASNHTQAVNRRNSRNSSGFVGVSFSTAANRWCAYIDLERTEPGKKNRKDLGYFDNLADAVEARKQAEANRHTPELIVTRSRHAVRLDNKSGAAGVSFTQKNQKWCAKIDLGHDQYGKRLRKHLGYFTDLQDAIRARKQAEIERDKLYNN